ncbi:hypothetical protein D9757_012429 [Collybiopsis confluens]|uniref:Uncharacterized protein n=1 Tax=Collybiopsis confluens TaxID=2823264 RepID=A0A8H5CXM2_9AGAR|nr:hypothetical protein D9757_012429 [Collybiopsis confluens]
MKDWYRKYNNVVDYVIYKGALSSYPTDKFALGIFFSRDGEDPNDLDKLSLRSVDALPLDVVRKMGMPVGHSFKNPTSHAHSHIRQSSGDDAAERKKAEYDTRSSRGPEAAIGNRGRAPREAQARLGGQRRALACISQDVPEYSKS